MNHFQVHKYNVDGEISVWKALKQTWKDCKILPQAHIHKSNTIIYHPWEHKPSYTSYEEVLQQMPYIVSLAE